MDTSRTGSLRLCAAWVILTIGPQIVPVDACRDLSDQRDSWQKPDEVVRAVGVRPGMTVVDVGAGTGYFTWRFAMAVGPHGRAIGLETDRAKVQSMSADALQMGLRNYEAKLVTPDDPALAPKSTDVLFICNTYRDIRDRVPYFRKVKPALREGGRVVIVEMKKTEEDTAPPREPRFDPEDIRSELLRAGFAFIREHKIDLPRQYLLEFKPLIEEVVTTEDPLAERLGP